MTQLALCHGCSGAGQCRLGLQTVRLEPDGSARFALHCPAAHQGGPGVAHGGWTAGAMNEILGQVVQLHGQTAVVGTLNVVYLRPVPLEHRLAAHAWIARREARKWHVAGVLTLDDGSTPLARAEGVFVLRDAQTHYAQFQAWLKQQ
jgi:acyl-coenzyme A thioesterase PaaI-like protein